MRSGRAGSGGGRDAGILPDGAEVKLLPMPAAVVHDATVRRSDSESFGTSAMGPESRISQGTLALTVVANTASWTGAWSRR